GRHYLYGVVFHFAVGRLADRSQTSRAAEAEAGKSGSCDGGGWNSKLERIRTGDHGKTRENAVHGIEHAVALEIDPRIELSCGRSNHFDRRVQSRHQKTRQRHAVFVIDSRVVITRGSCIRLAVQFWINACAEEQRTDMVPGP